MEFHFTYLLVFTFVARWYFNYFCYIPSTLYHVRSGVLLFARCYNVLFAPRYRTYLVIGTSCNFLAKKNFPRFDTLHRNAVYSFFTVAKCNCISFQRDPTIFSHKLILRIILPTKDIREARWKLYLIFLDIFLSLTIPNKYSNASDILDLFLTFFVTSFNLSVPMPERLTLILSFNSSTLLQMKRLLTRYCLYCRYVETFGKKQWEHGNYNKL